MLSSRARAFAGRRTVDPATVAFGLQFGPAYPRVPDEFPAVVRSSRRPIAPIAVAGLVDNLFH
jgi:hypothetical protein